MLCAYILLVKLKDVLIFLEDRALPKSAFFFNGLIVFKDIVTIVLHEADVSLIKVLAIICEQHKEDSVIIYGPILQKQCPLLVMCNL
jgi:hypothetical protein